VAIPVKPFTLKETMMNHAQSEQIDGYDKGGQK
jgi:hypothetical protein